MKIKQNKLDLQDRPMLLPYGRQWIDEDDIQAVVDVLRSERITQGAKIEEFEKALSEYCGARYAVAVNSGTSALHIACLASDVINGHEVITSPNTFVASANCAVYCGGKPVFADISPRTYNVSAEEIEKKITKQTHAVIPVDFAGQSCDMETIYRIVRDKEKEFDKKIFIIEDACQALGSYYKNKQAGSCSYSDMTVMSFHPVKHITTGEGGAVLTNDETLYNKLRRFRSHGITREPEFFSYKEHSLQFSSNGGQPFIKPWYYEQIDLGYNYRITDIQCALGISQLKKLDRFRKRRRMIVDIYNQAFRDIELVQTPFESEDCDTNFHLYVLLFDFDALGISRAQFMMDLERKGIHTQVHYIPVHTQPYYQKKFNTKWGDCPNAEQYYRNCLSIPIFPSMTELDVQRVIKSIKDIIA